MPLKRIQKKSTNPHINEANMKRLAILFKPPVNKSSSHTPSKFTLSRRKSRQSGAGVGDSNDMQQDHSSHTPRPTPQSQPQPQTELAKTSSTPITPPLTIPSGSVGSKITVKDMFTVLAKPFRLYLGGPSGMGKTTFIRMLLKYKDQMMDPKVDKIYWFYSMETSIESVRNDHPEI